MIVLALALQSCAESVCLSRVCLLGQHWEFQLEVSQSCQVCEKLLLASISPGLWVTIGSWRRARKPNVAVCFSLQGQ